jgi:uncharacterized protein YxeA
VYEYISRKEISPMKKILAVLLAVTIVTGMSVTAFAESRYYLANRELQLEDELEPYEPLDAPADNANAIPGTGC